MRPLPAQLEQSSSARWRSHGGGGAEEAAAVAVAVTAVAAGDRSVVVERLVMLLLLLGQLVGGEDVLGVGLWGRNKTIHETVDFLKIILSNECYTLSSLFLNFLHQSVLTIF